MSKIFNVHGNFDKTTLLKDVKAANTNAGTFTAGAYVTRVLNTQEGDTSFCTLSANQFTLPAGIYEIEASAPAYRVDSHKAKIRNITDSSDLSIGTSERNGSTANDINTTRSFVFAKLTLTSTKTFELQHRCETTNATNGLGLAFNTGESEVYAIVKIKKIG